MRLSLPALFRQPKLAVEPSAIVHSGFSGGYGETFGQYGLVGCGLLPASDIDWAQEAGDPTLNYVVATCLRWIADNLPEPERQVVDRTAEEDGTPALKPRSDHPLLDLLETPNPYYDGDALFAATAIDYTLFGNSYWLKERDNLKRVKALWYVPAWMIGPRWRNERNSPFITDYLYRPYGAVGGQGIAYPTSDVVHFQWGLDPQTGGRLGVRRVRSLLAWIATLNEGAIFMAALLRNMGIIPTLISTKSKMDEPGKQSFKEWWQSRSTRDNRGKPGVLDGMEATVQQLGLGPEDLTLDTSLNRPELVVCSQIGLHPGIFHFGSAGGKGFDNGGQLQEARRASYHDCLQPMTKRFGKTITHRFKADFPEFESGKTIFQFDFSAVEALQEDQDLLATRLVALYQGGLITRNEGRERLKLKPIKDEPVPQPLPGQGEDQQPQPDPAEAFGGH